MRRKCAICGLYFETNNPRENVCLDCEIIEELINYEPGEIDGKKVIE